MHQLLFIMWQESNNTGITLIDDQHRGIVSIINTFYYLVSIKCNPKMYLQLIDTIYNYSVIHFMAEEGILKTYEYKNIDHHKELHKKLLLEMDRIKRSLMKDNDPKPLLDFLKKWWIGHINNEDKQYAPMVLAGTPKIPSL